MAATFAELRFFLAKRHPGADPDLLDELINERLQSVVRGHNWKPLQGRAVLNTVAPITAGTVAVTNGSTTVNGTDTSWTSAITGRRFRAAGRNEWYTATYVSAVQLTLDRAYEGETATEAGYSIHQPVYSLASGIETLQSIEHVNGADDLDEISEEELNRLAPHRPAEGAPQCYVVIERDSDDDLQVELYPSPSAAWGMPYTYRKKVANLAAESDEIPDFVHRDAITFGVQHEMALVEKDQGLADRYEKKADKAVDKMLIAEAVRIGPIQLQMADRYTRRFRERGLK